MQTAAGHLCRFREDLPAALVADLLAVAVCASVRISDAVHEAGVETLTQYRGQGHARAAVAGWAHAVQQLGAAVCYSTSWENSASQHVATALGFELLGVDFHVT